MTLKSAIRTAITPLYIRARLAQERMQSGVAWYPLDPKFIADPYPTYRELRERDPYHPSKLTGMLVISRYEDVDEILRDWKRFSSERARRDDLQINDDPADGQIEASMLSLDPPDHTRLRGLVSRAFTPRVIAKMEDHIRATAHQLLDEVGDTDQFDLMENLASLLPTVVIAEMIGVPVEDREQFKVWSDRFARLLEPNLTEEEGVVVLQTAKEFRNYFAPIIEARRTDPRDDLVTRLVQAEEEGDKLTTDETQVNLRLLLVAGNETTTNLIGNGLRALLQHPEQLQLLREQPELIPNAIEELLRWDSPVQVDSRIAIEDVEIGDKLVKADSGVTLVIGGANRDPNEFDNPETLDVTREDAGNISFGRGIHHCLGAPLARLEARVAFEVLLERFDDIQLSGRTPTFKPNIVLRGLNHLDLQVKRASPARVNLAAEAAAD